MARINRLGTLASVPLALVLAHTTGVHAGPEESSGSVDDVLTPERAVALALEHHPALRAAEREIAGSQADLSVARSGWLPRIELSEDWNRSTNPTFVFASKLGQERFGPEDFGIDALNRPDPLTNAATRVTLRQNVWDAGRTRLGGRAAAAGLEAAEASFGRSRDQIAFGAVRAFWDAVLADEMLRVARAAEEAVTANLDLARARVEEGLAVPSDRIQAEVRLAEIRAMRVRAEAATRTARAGLRQALGLGEDREFRLEPPPVEPGSVPEDADALVQDALAVRGDLGALEARAHQASLGEKLARSRWYPEIGLGAQYEWNGTSLFGSDGSNWTFGAGMRLSLFDGLETRARVARARADRERLEAFREAAQEGVRLEVRAAVAEVVSADERLRTAVSALELAEEALRIVRERYGEGLAVMVELLGAEAARTGADGNLVAAAHDLALGRAALDVAVGRTPARAAGE